MARKVLKLTEVADLVGVPPSTIYYWRHINSGPPTWKIGRRVVAYEDEVRAWLDEQSRSTERRAG